MTTDGRDPSRPKALGRLEPLGLREIWPHEALDFTPWLLENPEVLGEALDMDLEITSSEHPVGGFSLDLVGKDRRRDETVIIKNQLETTDHLHLGQLLTYAAGTNAVNVVWVARGFREEHRAALDWLNSRTDPETRFFGVEVSVVRIGDSAPAPLFRLVAEPNDWGKTVRTNTQAREGCRIGDLHPGSILDRADWPAHIDWFVDTQRRLRSAVTTVGGIPPDAAAPEPGR